MRPRLLFVAAALATMMVAGAGPSTASTGGAAGTWACAGVDGVAALCLNNPWTVLPR